MGYAVLLLVCLLTVSTQASADTLDTIRSRGSLRVGMSGDYQPFSLCEGSSSECRGLDVEIAQRLAIDLGVTLEIIRFRWPELLKDLSDNAFDIAMSGVTIRPERALVATFTRPYLMHAPPPVGRDRKAYMLQRSDEALRNWLDGWLQERERDGFLSDVRQRWLGQEAVQQPFPPLAGLLALMDLRLTLMPAVAAYKQAHHMPIEDPQQEAAVLEKIGEQATHNGLAPSTTQALFRLQIEMAKQVQRHVLTSQQSLPAWTQGRDLQKELRPILSQLSSRIIQELLGPGQTSRDRDDLLVTVQQGITVEGVTHQTKRQLGQALWRIQAKGKTSEH